MGDCQNYGPFLGPYYNTGPNTGPNLGDPKRDHNFDNYPYVMWLLKRDVTQAKVVQVEIHSSTLAEARSDSF